MKKSGHVGEAGGIVAQRTAQKGGADGDDDHPRRAVPAGHARLHEREVQRGIGTGPEFALVEAQDRRRLRHARVATRTQARNGPGGDGDVAARRLAPGFEEAADGHRDVLAGQVLPVVDARAAGLRAQGRLLSARRRPSCPRARPGGGRPSRSRPLLPADTRATGSSRRASPRSRCRRRTPPAAPRLQHLALDPLRPLVAREAHGRGDLADGAGERAQRDHHAVLVAHAEEEMVAALARADRDDAQLLVQPQADRAARDPQAYAEGVGCRRARSGPARSGRKGRGGGRRCRARRPRRSEAASRGTGRGRSGGGGRGRKGSDLPAPTGSR